MEGFPTIPEPVSISERYLHGILIRMDALCNMMNSFLEVYGNQSGVATQDVQVQETPPTPRKRTTRKG